MAQVTCERWLPGATDASDVGEWKGSGDSDNAMSGSHRWRCAIERETRSQSGGTNCGYHGRVWSVAAEIRTSQISGRRRPDACLSRSISEPDFRSAPQPQLFHYFLGDRLRDYEDAVAVADDIVSRLDVDSADGDANIVSDKSPAADDVNGSLVSRKHRKFQLQNIVGVACASVNHRTACAAKLCSLAESSPRWAARLSCGWLTSTSPGFTSPSIFRYGIKMTSGSSLIVGSPAIVRAPPRRACGRSGGIESPSAMPDGGSPSHRECH